MPVGLVVVRYDLQKTLFIRDPRRVMTIKERVHLAKTFVFRNCVWSLLVYRRSWYGPDLYI